jgi:hypothetical protein
MGTVMLPMHFLCFLCVQCGEQVAQEGLWWSDCPLLKTYHEGPSEAVEWPMDMIDQIGGWKSVSGVGVGYGQGYQVTQIMGKVAITNTVSDL